MSTYCLAPDVHACIADAHIVFLDKKRDKYLALPPDATPILRDLIIERRFDLSSIDNSCLPQSDIYDLVQSLESAKLIAPGNTMPSVPANPISPVRDISDAHFGLSGTADLGMLLRFVRAWIFGLYGIKVLGLHRLTKRLASLQSKGRVAPFTLEDAVYGFRDIRSAFYTAKDHCYFDCAVMTYFLKSYGFDARWIFAVCMPEFEAHCWVQVGETVASDYLAATFHYTPIMVV